MVSATHDGKLYPMDQIEEKERRVERYHDDRGIKRLLVELLTRREKVVSKLRR